MPRTGRDADGHDRTGRRGDTYLMAREAGYTLQEIAAQFGVTREAVNVAIKRAEKRAAKAKRRKGK